MLPWDKQNPRAYTKMVQQWRQWFIRGKQRKPLVSIMNEGKCLEKRERESGGAK